MAIFMPVSLSAFVSLSLSMSLSVSVSVVLVQCPLSLCPVSPVPRPHYLVSSLSCVPQSHVPPSRVPLSRVPLSCVPLSRVPLSHVPCPVSHLLSPLSPAPCPLYPVPCPVSQLLCEFALLISTDFFRNGYLLTLIYGQKSQRTTLKVTLIANGQLSALITQGMDGNR